MYINSSENLYNYILRELLGTLNFIQNLRTKLFISGKYNIFIFTDYPGSLLLTIFNK